MSPLGPSTTQPGLAFGHRGETRRHTSRSHLIHGALDGQHDSTPDQSNAKPVEHDIREAGHSSVRAIASELNKRGIRTARDRQWHPTSADRRGLSYNVGGMLSTHAPHGSIDRERRTTNRVNR